MDLFDKLQAKYPKNFDTCFDFGIGEGWNNLVERLVDQVIALQPDIKIEQVKEKFGELRFYVDSATEDVYFLIETAEDASERTCDVCGAEGSISIVNGWYACRCEEHK